MRIRLLSDIHTEFHADGGASFIEALGPANADVVVVAGDVSNSRGVERTLCILAARFAPVPVLYVAGNHEFYRSGRAQTRAQIGMAVEKSPGLHWLDNDAVTVHEGNEITWAATTESRHWRRADVVARVLGTTLWFWKSALNGPRHMMHDFTQIHDFAKWVGEENRKSVEFLRRELREGDIVVTHYLPSRACVAPKYTDSLLNDFFVCDLTDLILERKPALWLFGHTHESVDVAVGSTRCVSNPFGYVRHEINPNFNPDLVLEV